MVSRLMAVVLVVFGSMGYASVASAGPSRSQAISIFYRSNSSFMSIRSRSGSYRGYDWSTDGCSVPYWVKVVFPTMRYASQNFNSQCIQHDFGYRNFGGRLDLDNNLSRKYSVDARFYFEMQVQCARGWWSQSTCRGHAWVFYKAVYYFGRFT